MKKVILGLSGAVIAAFMIILVANAQTGSQEVKKADTEVVKDCGKCGATSGCAEKADAKTSEAKECCKNTASASTEAKKCEKAKPCCASKN